MNEYRPCFVNNKKALFHKWVTEDGIILKMNATLKPTDIERIHKFFEDMNTAPACASTEKVSKTYALVEFEDGTIDVVEPNKIRFLDSWDKFRDKKLYFERV